MSNMQDTPTPPPARATWPGALVDIVVFAGLFVLTAMKIIPPEPILGLAFAFLGAKIGQLQAAKNGGTGAGPLGGSTLVALVVGAASLWAASRRGGGVT